MGLTPEEIREQKDAMTAPAREAMEHVYGVILQIPQFTLRDGTPCTVEAFYPPEQQEDDEMNAVSIS